MKQQMFTFQVPTALMKKVKKLAKEEGVSVSHCIRVMIKDYLAGGK